MVCLAEHSTAISVHLGLGRYLKRRVTVPPSIPSPPSSMDTSSSQGSSASVRLEFGALAASIDLGATRAERRAEGTPPELAHSTT